MTSSTAETPRSAAIYCRISQDREGAGLGVERQEEECRALADRLGWQVARVYTDNDISAYSGKPRPGYRRMLADIEAGAVTAVIAWHPDRLHRQPRELERYIDVSENDRRSVPTSFVRAGNYDLSTATGRMIARQIGVQARYESELKSERVRAARVQQAKGGKFHGGNRPYGFEKDGVTVRPDEAAEIAKAAAAVAGGQSLRSVVLDLNARQVPTATGKIGAWTGQQVRDMLTRPRTAGLSEHKGEVVGKAVWPAIVDEPTWRTVCAILKNPARRTNHANAGAVRWIGSGTYICGVCEQRKLRVGISGTKKRLTYRCGNRDITKGGNHVTREAPALDKYVESLVVERLSEPGLVERLMRRDNAPDVNGLMLEQVQLGERKSELVVMFTSGEISRSQLSTGTADVERRLEMISRQLAASGWRSPLEPLAGSDSIRDVWFGTEDDRSDGLPLAARRAIMSAVVDITVLPAPRQNRPGCIDPSRVKVDWLVDPGEGYQERDMS